MKEMMENNQIIAEFMGCKHSKYEDMYSLGCGDFHYEDLAYDYDWNWLMPVANEIIKSRDEQNADWDLTDLKYSLQTTNIELVYKAVVDFIKNQNN
tara:strand:+ start:160 stop:447 length:288 start_codon:yes stop_codon:yes gene_type:complete